MAISMKPGWLKPSHSEKAGLYLCLYVYSENCEKHSVFQRICYFNRLHICKQAHCHCVTAVWKRDTGPTAQDGGMGVERHGAAQEGTILSQLLQHTLLMLPGAQSTPEMCSQSTEDPNSLGQMTGDSPAFQYLEQRKKF